jgi:hypothetical protein
LAEAALMEKDSKESIKEEYVLNWRENEAGRME